MKLRSLPQLSFTTIVIIAISIFLPSTLAKLALGKGKALFVNDGFYYYNYTVSLVLDRDLDFSNQYEFNRGLANKGLIAIVPETGRPKNLFAIGAGLIWSPAFLLAHLCILALKSSGLPLSTTGFELYYQIPTYFWGFFVGLAGMMLTYRLLHIISNDEMLARWTTATALFGTTISVYAFMHCNFAHWTSVGMVALCLCAAIYLTQHPERLFLWFLSGLALGIATLVRWQSASLILLFVGAAWHLIKVKRFRTIISGIAVLFVGAALAFIPQLLAWHTIFGAWFVIPQGKEFMHWTSPRLLYALFSLRHGLFVWSPIWLLAVWGFLKKYEKVPKSLQWSVLSTLMAQVYINSVPSDFIGIGLRRMTDYTPLFALGLLIAFATLKEQRREQLVPILSGGAIALNWLMIVGIHLLQWLQQGEFHML